MTSGLAIVTQGFQSSGGVQTVARWLLEGASKAGYDVTVYDLATSWRDPDSMRILSPRTWLTRPQVRQSAEPGVHHVGAMAAELELMRYAPRSQLTALLRQHDLVQVVSGGPSLAMAASRCGRPVLLQVATMMRWERASITAERRGLRWMWAVAMTAAVSILERRAVRTADSVFVENAAMLSEIQRIAPSVNAFVAPPGIDTDRYHPASGGWRPDRRIISLGRLNEPRKGLARMLSAYAALRARWPADLSIRCPDLMICGFGDPVPLQERARELGVDEHVSIVADVLSTDLPRLLQESSVFWQTSFEEGLGIAVLEAMASGLPVVATSTAGTDSTIVEGVTGRLLTQDANLTEAIAVATVEILGSGQVGASMSAAARDRTLKHFSTAATLRLFLDRYQELVPNSGPGCRRPG